MQIPQTHIVPVDEVKLHVVTWGKPSAPPLVLLHGFTGNAFSWRALAEPLSRAYYVIAFDLIGHGKSDSPNDVTKYSMPNVAQQVMTALGQFTAQPAHWIGYSMGGRLALYCAVHHPCVIRSLTLESASPGLETDAEQQARRQADAKLAERILEKGIVAFVDEWERLPLFATQQHLSSEIIQQVRQSRLMNHPLGLANSLKGMGTGSQPSLWSELTNLKMPVCLITGALDIKFCEIAEKMQHAIPQQEWHVVQGAGHTVHLEALTPYLENVELFLARHG